MIRVYPVPPFAPGRYVELPGRGTTFVRELAGPPGAPTVLLLHGWIAPGGLNWYTAMPQLAERYHVLAVDMRGQGRGLRSATPYTFEQCADDAAALLDVLGVERAQVVGYSMGGQVAPVLATRHPDRVSGLTLVSAVALDHDGPVLGAVLRGVRALFRRLPLAVRAAWWLPGILGGNGVTRPLDEIGRDSPLVVAQSGLLSAAYDTSDQLRLLRIPTSVIVSARDWTVSPASQRQAASLVPGARIIEMQAGHTAPWIRPARFSAAVRRGVDMAAGLA